MSHRLYSQFTQGTSSPSFVVSFSIELDLWGYLDTLVMAKGHQIPKNPDDMMAYHPSHLSFNFLAAASGPDWNGVPPTHTHNIWNTGLLQIHLSAGQRAFL